MNKTICIFCAVNDVHRKYVTATKKLGKLMVKNGFDLVWGGTNEGLMKVIADTVEHHGGKLIGVTAEIFHHRSRPNIDEMIVAKDIASRKKILFKKADAFVLLPGGIGSLDEITEILELRKHDLHHKPTVVLNIDNFYGGLKSQLQRMEKEGFLKKKLEEMICFADSPLAAINYINNKI